MFTEDLRIAIFSFLSFLWGGFTLFIDKKQKTANFRKTALRGKKAEKG